MGENFPEFKKNMNPLIEGKNNMWVWLENKMQICCHYKDSQKPNNTDLKSKERDKKQINC